MCTYITAVLPRKAVHEEMNALFRQHFLGFEVFSNHHLAESLAKDDVLISTTGKFCDCGTSLGSLASTKTEISRKSEDPTAKLRKKGWSEAKINRWLEQKSLNSQKDSGLVEQAKNSPDPEALQWCELISFLLKSGKASRFGLMWHEYSRAIESERIELTIRQIPVRHLTPLLLMEMPENVLYSFIAN